MSSDSSTDRPGFDSILQTCEQLQTDEMTSRERCQALLWECQATKVLDKENTDDQNHNAVKSKHYPKRESVCGSVDATGSSKLIDQTSEKRNPFKDQETIDSEYSKTNDNPTYEHRHPKPSSPSLSAFVHPVMDPNMVFSPINPVSGNPHVSMNPVGSGDMTLMNKTQTFVPIAVPVPAAGPSPMWYMTPTGMVSLSQMGHHPGYFVPLQHGSVSSGVPENEAADAEDDKPVRRASRSSTPTKSDKADFESRRSSTPSNKSKIPRPVWGSQKSPSSRPQSPTTSKTYQHENISHRGDNSKNDTINSSPYRSNTPPTKLRSGSTGQERGGRRFRSESTSSRLEEKGPRSASPRLDRSRPSSPSLSGANSGSRPSSPLGSRSSSPVSVLISKFEELTENKPSENTQSVSNLLNKFGSSSLLSEDRITKRHFRSSSVQNPRTGPLRPSSTMEQSPSSLTVDSNKGLSRSWSGQTSEQPDRYYDSSDSVHSSPEKVYSPERNRERKHSPLAHNQTNSAKDKKESLADTARNHLMSSLENLYESLKDSGRNESDRHSLGALQRNWTSLENINRDIPDGSRVTNSLRKASSAENLSSRRIDSSSTANWTYANRTICTEKGRKKPWRTASSDSMECTNIRCNKNDKVSKTDLSKASEISDLFRNLDKNSGATGKEIRKATSFLPPERDYHLKHGQELSSSFGRNRFEIPVSLAVLDSENVGHGPFSSAMFSPTAHKEKGFFQHPIKLEKDPPPLSPPAPLSPSVKDCEPTSYFTNISFIAEDMKPERDMGPNVHASKQNRLEEKLSKTDSIQIRNSYKNDYSISNPVEGDTDEGVPQRSKSRHSSSSGSSSGNHSGRRGSNSSKVSSGYHSDYLDRFERKLSRKCSNNIEDEPEHSGSDHHSHASSHYKDDVKKAIEFEKVKERSKPTQLALSLDSKPSSSSNNISTSTKSAPTSKPCSAPNTPTGSYSVTSSSPFGISKASTSVPSTPNNASKNPTFFKYVSPNSPVKKLSSRPPSSEPYLNTHSPEVGDFSSSYSRKTQYPSEQKGFASQGTEMYSENTSPPVKDRDIKSPTEPRSPTSSVSSSSSASSPSPRFPVNSKFIFYNPQNETANERHFSPTEHVSNSNQKGFVITDTSRQRKSKKQELKAENNNETSRNFKPDIKSSRQPIVTNLMNEHDRDRKMIHSLPSSDKMTKEIHQDVDRNMNTIDNKSEKSVMEIKSVTNATPNAIPAASIAEKVYERKAAREKHRQQSIDSKTDAKEEKKVVTNRRRGSIDLVREIYHQARRSSLAACTESGNSSSGLEALKLPTSPRSNSSPPNRPPSPGRVDSKELLGHFVKKMLNSKQQQSPSSSHGDLSHGHREPASLSSAFNTCKSNSQPSQSSIERKISCEKMERKVSEERRHRKVSKEEKKRKMSPGEKGNTSYENRRDSQRQRVSFENKGQVDGHEDSKSHRRKPSLELKAKIVHKEQGADQEKSQLMETKDKPVQKKVAAKSLQPTNATMGDRTAKGMPGTGKGKTDRRTRTEPSGEKDALTKLIEMIHDEFAFDGYLDDGIEDVNMAEYITSLAGMDEAMFKESISDQYSDLYWDDDLLQDMYILVNKSLTTRRPTLRYSESTAGEICRPGSSMSVDSHQDMNRLSTISRTSSERSFVETRDYVMLSLGEPSQFLPFKLIAPDTVRDIIDELGPVYEDYQKVMKVKLSPSISDLLEKLGAKILEIGQQLTLERRAKRKNIASFNKVADVDHKKDVKDLANTLLQEIEESDKKIIYLKYIQRRLRNIYAERFGLDHSLLHSFVKTYGQSSIALEPKRQNSCLSFSPLWDQRSNQSPECHGESTRGPVLQYGRQEGLLSYLFARHAMSQAYVRYFLYTYRYCSTAHKLFEFIRDKCRASLRVDSEKTYNHQLQIRYRALDILAEWVHCCYTFDIKTNPDLMSSLLAFLNEEVNYLNIQPLLILKSVLTELESTINRLSLDHKPIVD